MKKTFIASVLLFCAVMAQAQEQVRIWLDGSGSTRFTTSELTFSDDGTTLSVADSTYDVARIDSIAVVHTVTVTFDGDTAYVDHGHAANLTDTIHGAHVILNSTNTKSELEFVLQGTSTHGSLTYDGPLKCKFRLNGLNLTSDEGPALNIECGKRIDLILEDGTENYLCDTAGGDHKAALRCKGHIETSGGGSLTVTGKTKHGIDTKEYMQIGKTTGSITVNGAVNDAMHIGQYFKMNGGTLTISGQGGEGIQVETMTIITEAGDTIPNPDKEDNGLMFICGGVLNVTASADCTKGIKAPSDLTVSGGTLTIAASGDGSKGISVSGNMLVNEDDNTTLITVRASGSVYEDEETEDESYCMGMKIKGNLTVNAGTIMVSNKGYGTRGIKIGGTYTKSDAATVKASITTK